MEGGGAAHKRLTLTLSRRWRCLSQAINPNPKSQVEVPLTSEIDDSTWVFERSCTALAAIIDEMDVVQATLPSVISDY